MTKKIALNTNTSIILVDIRDIIYFEKENKNIKVVLRNYKRTFYIRKSLKSLQIILEEANLFNLYFFKPHGSYIVNALHICEINSTQLYMTNNQYIPISYNNRKQFSHLILENYYII